MIIIRQKEFARAIPKEALIRELERRGLKSGVPKYISKGYKTVENPNYIKDSEIAFQKWQNRGRSRPTTGKYEDLGINQRINLKGTMEHQGYGEYSTNMSNGGKIKWKNKKASRKAGYVDHPSKLLDNYPALKAANDTKWNFNELI